MKAVRVNEYGKPVQLEDIAQPTPAADEALVLVHAASINPVDSAVMAGYMSFMTSVPLTLGTDFSGTVVSVGKDLGGFKPGDEVYGLIPMRVGTFSEYTTPKAHEMALKPKSLSHIQASTVPLPSMAAWQSLFELGKYQDGERVLIHGVAGAVGGLAAQFAKNAGAYVYGTDIPEKAAHAAQFGIDRFIDVKSERFEDVVENVDVVLDFIGGEFLDRSLNVLQSGGRYVTALMIQAPPAEAEQRGIQVAGLASQPRGDLLTKIAGMLDEGSVKTFVNRTFPLSEAQDALNYRFVTKDPGKIVLTVL